MSTASPSRGVAFAAVLLVVLAALGLRWRGIGWGLPHQTYRDGMVVSTQVDLLRAGAEDPGANEFWGYYPHLLSRLVDLASGDWDQPVNEPLALDAHLERASEPWLTAREVSVVLSLLAVAGAYLVARRFLGFGWSLFAAALVATSAFHLSFAQQEKPHGPISGTVVLAVLTAVWWRRRPSVATSLAAIGGAALAVITLQSGAAALPALATAWLLRWRDGKRQLAWNIPLAAVVLALAVRVFYPFHFDAHVEAPVVKEGVSLGGHPLDLQKFHFGGAKNMAVTLYLFEPVLVVLALAGLVAFAVRRWKRVERDAEARRDLWVMGAFFVPYSFALCAYEDAFDRFLMPLVPFLAALAAYGAAAIASSWSRTAAVAFGALLLAVPAAAACRMGSVRAHPDTATRVATWIREHARPDERIYVFPYVDLPLFYSSAAVAELGGEDDLVLTWMAYQAKLDPATKLGDAFTVIPPGRGKDEIADLGKDPLGRLRERGARYVVIQAFGERYRQKVLVKLREQLQAGAKLVFRASPFSVERDSGRVWIRYAMTFDQEPAWWRLFRERSVGTTLEVYSIE